MSKQLYEEALADVRKVTEVAEDNAKRAILEAVTPRIRELIERELLNEDSSEDDEDDDEDEKVLTDKTNESLNAIGGPKSEDSSPSPGDGTTGSLSGEDDKEEDSEEVEKEKPTFTKESLNSHLSLVDSVTKQMLNADESILIKNSTKSKITRMISKLENMYEYVQESVKDLKVRRSYEDKLESRFQVLNGLQELAMKKVKDLLREAGEDELGMGADLDAEPAGDEMGGEELDLSDEGGEEGSEGELTLTIKGLGDVNPEDVEIDVVGGEEDGEEDLDLDTEEGGEEGMEMGPEEPEEGGMGESLSRLSDDTIVEIDENMLRKEISRMKRLREEASSTKPGDANGHGVGPNEFDDFGGAESEGDPWEGAEVTTAKNESRIPAQNLQRRIAFEKKLQDRTKQLATELREEASNESNPRRVKELRTRYTRLKTRFNESLTRMQKFQKVLAEAKSNQSSNRTATNRSADATTLMLRKRLAEENLRNAKLTFANKILQSELSNGQKRQLVKKIDEARNVGQVKALYEKIVKSMNKVVSEGVESRELLGSSSKTARPGSTQISEGFETDRWATLAGINK